MCGYVPVMMLGMLIGSCQLRKPGVWHVNSHPQPPRLCPKSGESCESASVIAQF